MADETPADEVPVTFSVKSSNDAKYTLTVPLTTTVSDLKSKLSSSEYADIPPERQRLIYSGRVLKDPDTLGSYKIKEGHTIHLVKGAASNQRQNPANQGTSASPVPSGVPTNIAAGTGNNPLAGLTGARYAGFAQLPGQEMFGPDGGMGPPPDPEHMISMLQNPQFASTLNEALQNPQLIDMMIQQNPQLRGMGPEVRQMMQTPEFRRMMTDPEQLRNMTQLQRMFGGGMPGMGGGGASAFPAPGATDTTPGQESNRATQPTPQLPFNPMAMFANPAAAGGAPGANPFAALFNPAGFGQTPAATPPPPASAGQRTPAGPGTPAPADGQGSSLPAQPGQAGFNPFANMANPFLTNPQMMQQMLQAMGGGGSGAIPNSSAPASSDPATNPFAALFAPGGMLGGQGFSAAAAPVDSRPPEERYAEQLRQLNDMGFYEFDRNVEALRRTGGSVQGAVEYLLTH
ncbi:hypothetical protein MMC26_006613 [Xylographa opegraphella]|nr:hypothetical protein [Xylographa opegraphella]